MDRMLCNKMTCVYKSRLKRHEVGQEIDNLPQKTRPEMLARKVFFLITYLTSFSISCRMSLLPVPIVRRHEPSCSRISPLLLVVHLLFLIVIRNSIVIPQTHKEYETDSSKSYRIYSPIYHNRLPPFLTAVINQMRRIHKPHNLLLLPFLDHPSLPQAPHQHQHNDG